MNTTPSAASFRRAWRAAIAACCAGLLVAQAPAPPPVDPALPDQLKELKSMVGDSKMQLDFQAISLMQKLVGEVAGKNPKDQERMAKAFGDVFRAGKLRTGDKEILYRETADALAKMKADGAKELAKAVTDARFKESLPLQAHMILALGRTEDEKQVEWLLETTIRSPRDELKAAAGEALGNFTSLEIKQRREVVKGIIREWGSLHQKATQAESNDPNGPVNLEPQTARATLRAVESKWVATLNNLTGVSQSGFQEWQRWLNKNPGWTPPGAKKS